MAVEGARLVTLGELLRRRVVTEDGARIGRVWDVRVHIRGGRASVVALAVGGVGLRKRLAGNVQRGEVPENYVPWEDVVRVDADAIVVRRRG